MDIEFVRGDITEQRVDAVVNAANSSLLGGGGVDGAIHRRGGPAILAQCRELRASRYRDGLPTGQAVATTAGDLPARWVIHTVGPVYAQSEDRSDLLASCYRKSLRVADDLGAVTVAFPAVSAGGHGGPAGGGTRVGTGPGDPTRVGRGTLPLHMRALSCRRESIAGGCTVREVSRWHGTAAALVLPPRP